MIKNKFNNFYSRKPLNELIELLRQQRITGNRLDDEWYAALKLHLLERELTSEERNNVDYLLSDDFEIELVSINKKEKIHTQKRKSLFTIDNPDKILDAGKSLKNVAHMSIVLIFLTIVGPLFINSSNDIESIKNAQLITGTISIICLIIILISLYSAGNSLINSVTKAQEDEIRQNHL